MKEKRKEVKVMISQGGRLPLLYYLVSKYILMIAQSQIFEIHNFLLTIYQLNHQDL